MLYDKVIPTFAQIADECNLLKCNSMINNDIIQRFLFENHEIRGQLVRLGESFQTIAKQHDYPPALKNLLGESLVLSVLLNAIIKLKGRLSVQFNGAEPLKLLMAQCNQDYQIRGLADWEGNDLDQEALLNALKKGTLGIIIRPDDTSRSYQGIVQFEGQSLAQSIEHYFKYSEQLPTRIWVSVDDNQAAGLLLQAMPSSGLKKAQPVPEDDVFQHVVHLAETITKEELLVLNNEVLLNRLFREEEIRLFSPASVEFGCTCSLEKSKKAVLMLGQEEGEKELQAKQEIVVICEFCNTEYHFDRVDVAKLFKDDDSVSKIH